MNCPNCKKEVLDNARFCPFCGSPTALRCVSCGAQLEPDQAFCAECGARVERPGSAPANVGTSQPAYVSPSTPISQPQAPYVPPGAPTPTPSSGGSPTASSPSVSLHYDPVQQAQTSQYYGPGQTYAEGTYQPTAAGAVTVGVGRRFGAVIVDGILLYVLFYFIARSFGIATTTYTQGFESGFSMSGPASLLSMFLGFAYYWILEGTLGATFGKMLFGCKVIMIDGGKCTLGASALRNILRIVDSIPYLIPYLLGAILIWTSPNKQRLGDRVAKTLVVRR